jgi:hypothetical protein
MGWSGAMNCGGWVGGPCKPALPYATEEQTHKEA